MLIVESYALAVALCVVTMLCWGSWANTQKLASQEWRFQLFYWDYAIGVLLLALLARLHRWAARAPAGAASSPTSRQAERPQRSARRSSAASSSTCPTSCWSRRSTSPAWPSPSRSASGSRSCSASITNYLATPVGNARAALRGCRGRRASPSCSRPPPTAGCRAAAAEDARQGHRDLGRGRPADGLLLPLRRGRRCPPTSRQRSSRQAQPLHRHRRVLRRACCSPTSSGTAS